MHLFNLADSVLDPGRGRDINTFINYHNKWMTMHVTGKARKNGYRPFYRVKVIFLPSDSLFEPTRMVRCTKLVYR